jgi:regulatory protein YycI of two-component signal transduction system YycFG
MEQIKILNEIIKETEIISSEYKQVEYYYVYATFFFDGNFYIGSRISRTTPETDVKYIGSYKDKELYKDGEKVILKTFSSESEMIYYETSLIKKFKDHPKCINVNTTPRTCTKVYSSKDLISSKDLRTMFGFSSASTLCNWIHLTGIERVKMGRSYYVSSNDVNKLNELSNYIKSGNGYESYLKSQGKTDNEIESILSKIRGI